MNILMINGSPRTKESNSGLVLEMLREKLIETDITSYQIVYKNQFQEALDVDACDVLLFAFPLYVDGIPSHLLRFLEAMEENKIAGNPTVYCCINNGFYEGSQNQVAMAQMQLWCEKVGLTWGQGIGIGCGEMLPFLKKIPADQGPKKNLGKALTTLTENMLNLRSGEDIFFNHNWPRSLWKIQANSSFWLPQAKKNGLTKEDLYRKIIEI